jgi:hypothetical protein
MKLTKMTIPELVTWVKRVRRDALSTEYDQIICAERPWSLSSVLQLYELDDLNSLPKDAFPYFLEPETTLDLIEALEKYRPNHSMEDACRLIVYYAENDAHPEWLWEKE